MTNNTISGEVPKASLALLLLLITALTIPHVPAQRRARRPTPPSTQQGAYDRAYGIYTSSGEIPKAFGDVSQIEITFTPESIGRNGAGAARGAECALVVEEMLARPKRTTMRGADGRPLTIILDRENREYRATELRVTTQALAFATIEVAGVGYSFEGKFINARPTRREPEPIALEGLLIKSEGGRKTAEGRFRFTVIRGD